MPLTGFLKKLRERITNSEKSISPQLLMWYGTEKEPEIGPLASGYHLRPFEEEDEEGWCRVLNAHTDLGRWDIERVRGELEGDLVRQGQQFALAGEVIVATAGVYSRQRPEGEAWEIGWVATRPEHRGKGLGGQVTAAAVKVALRQPRRPIFLLTDDARLPALKVYLKLGFVPDLRHSSYPERWRTIFGLLGDGYAVYQPESSRDLGKEEQ
jgi:mycothiol synthase